MKCLNMDVVVILFLIANFISIESATMRKNETKVINEEILKNTFDEDCPGLLKMIQNKGLSNYTISCKEISHTKSHEDILEHACFVVTNMFKVICNKEFSEASLNLLGRENITNICPFDFSHLQSLDLNSVFKNHESVKTLASKDTCENACFEFYYTVRPQCVLLSKFNNYIRLRNSLSQPDVVKLAASPQVTNTSIRTATETAASQANKKELLSGKNEANSIAPSIRIETEPHQVIASQKKTTDVSKKEKKVEKPVLTITPKEEMQVTEKTEAPQVDTKMPEVDIKMPEVDIDRPVSKSNDRLPEEEFSDEEDFPKVDDSLPSSGVVRQDTDSQKMDNLEDKETSYLREKNNYVGEGFSQAEDSHFFFYFIMMSSIVVVGYLAFHNKNKILAYALEGSSGRRNRRRPNPARYRKLETNLEEVISSSTTNATTSSVVY